MDDFIARVSDRMRKEILYGRGMLVMHRERREEYDRDLHQALAAGNYVRARQVAEDLTALLREARVLRRKLISAQERRLTLRIAGTFASQSEREGADRPPDGMEAQPAVIQHID